MARRQHIGDRDVRITPRQQLLTAGETFVQDHGEVKRDGLSPTGPVVGRAPPTLVCCPSRGVVSRSSTVLRGVICPSAGLVPCCSAALLLSVAVGHLADSLTATVAGVTIKSPLRFGSVEWSAAHQAVELEDLIRLQELLDAGHDVEDGGANGWTLLRHAIDVEIDSHTQSGEPLHVDVTALLLARGADPRRTCDGVSAVVEAELRGHWLAAELMRAWIGRSAVVSAHVV